MSSHNFIDADNSVMEKNLRFVKVFVSRTVFFFFVIALF